MDLSHEAKAKDSTRKAKAKTKDFKIVLEDPRERGLVLEDSNTAITATEMLSNSVTHNSDTDNHRIIKIGMWDVRHSI